MKHGQEKSDLFIVALKPANKPGRLGAEPVEPRRGPRGTRESNTRAGHRAGKACPRGLIVYEELLVSFPVNHPRWEPGA